MSVTPLNCEHPNDAGDNKACTDGEAAAAAAVGHPYDFAVCGPRNISSPSWKDLICSSWKDANYRRMVIACFIQAVYLLELDRQDGRGGDGDDTLAPKWWKPFKYKLAQTLIDDRDGSIYGAVLEWDRSAALADLVLLRPAGAPKAVLALRGTILKKATAKRDIQDDLRFLAWESLKGSVRFAGALEALKALAERHGSSNVCVGGHSLGAGFALQVGKAMAKQGVFVDCHLFNPPSVSVAMALRSIGERAVELWRWVRESLPLKEEDKERDPAGNAEEGKSKKKKWLPHLYVNSSDYICCHYGGNGGGGEAGEKEIISGVGASEGEAVAKLFVVSKGPKTFLEAHGLQQWWSDEAELQLAIHHSRLIDRQLSSLYKVAPPPPAGAASPARAACR